MAEGLERARRHWKTRMTEGAVDIAPAAPAYTITLSREAGAGGSLVARSVGVRLGWPVYDHELLQRIAQEMGHRATLLESVDERQVSWLRSFLESFSSARAVSDSGFVRHLVEVILALGAQGECILVGRGAGQILPPETTLRVRLVGPVRERIAAVSRRRGISREEAARYVETTDRERVRFVADHFHKDATDPRNYDLVLNSSRLALLECTNLIVETLRRLQSRTAATPSPGSEPVPAAVGP
jgi:cytidylate kinase